MEPQKYGKIINIASIAGISTGSTHRPDAVLKEAARQRRIEVLIERE
jgi:NADP-dependent 3-hydroxy acid dehydrogenase YdfG